ncbi:MAG: hypothetical protein QM765_35855 [Myxococcales bacterium]
MAASVVEAIGRSRSARRTPPASTKTRSGSPLVRELASWVRSSTEAGSG